MTSQNIIGFAPGNSLKIQIQIWLTESGIKRGGIRYCIASGPKDKESDERLPSLDILLTRDEDGSLNTSVYRKPTHTDQYLGI